MVSGICEHFSDHTSRLTNILVNNGTGHNLQKVAVQLTGNGTGQQSLASTRWTVQQYTLWWDDTDSQEQLGVDQRQLDNFTDLANLLLETSDLAVCHLAWVFVRHVVDKWVDFTGQVAHDCQCGHVQGDTSSRLQLGFIQLATAADYITRSICCFDNNLNNIW